MYGLIVSINVNNGQRDQLMTILHEGFHDVPGCIYHHLAKDKHDDTLVWVSEAWVSQADYTEALKSPHVKTAISKAKPMIVALKRVETTPVL